VNVLDLFRSEPAVAITAISGLVDAVLLLLVTFGVPISGPQKAAVDGVLAALMAVLAVLTGMLVRSQVTPVVKPGS
jgi:hypothetical protein